VAGMNFMKSIVNTFVMILTGITLSSAIFITVFIPKQTLSVEILWQIIGMSLVCSLGNLFYFSKKEIGKQNMRLRIICHYLYINIIVFGGAFLFDWCEPKYFPQLIVLFLLIVLVYIVIMLTEFKYEKITAEKLNHQLRKWYPPEDKGDI
jgi:uncharacterized membrane protein YfcA